MQLGSTIAAAPPHEGEASGLELTPDERVAAGHFASTQPGAEGDPSATAWMEDYATRFLDLAEDGLTSDEKDFLDFLEGTRLAGIGGEESYKSWFTLFARLVAGMKDETELSEESASQLQRALRVKPCSAGETNEGLHAQLSAHEAVTDATRDFVDEAAPETCEAP